MFLAQRARLLRGPAVFVLTLLAIEFLDEFAFGARETAWPFIRQDLKLSYDQIGLLIAVPTLIAALIEPVLGILADIGHRRLIILVGGVSFALAAIFTAISGSFLALMLSFIFFAPASGAFVALSQAALMDVDPTRHEHNMARWTFAGSLGVLSGSLVISSMTALGSNWRVFYLGVGLITLLLWFITWRVYPRSIETTAGMSDATVEDDDDGETLSFRAGLRAAFVALRRREVLRWLTLLQFSDLMLDGLHAYLALYMVDVVGVSETEAGLTVAIWTGVGLIGDFLLIPLLERVRGLTYLRISVLAELVLFPLFILVPGFLPKLVVIGVIGMANAGWYSILQGRLYTAMPGQSGTVLALNNLAGLVGAAIPFLIGVLAERFGLGAAMWFFMLGPIALLIGLSRD
jgi:MFS transporter, FSR family, fosmidomycin resistance protein